MSEPTGGTFTFNVGRAESDPLPYNASGEEANAAFRQACERNQGMLSNSPDPYETDELYDLDIDWDEVHDYVHYDEEEDD